jgi:hypothetical protein
MLEHTFVRTSVIARLRHGPLGPYLDDLATTLHHQGYAPSSIQLYLRTAEQFTQWLQGQGYVVSEMDGDLVQRYVSGLTRYRSGKLPKAAQGLSHLVRFLHHQGVVSSRPAELSPIEQWLVDYDAHLEQVAGLARSTRQGYRRIVRRFIAACFGAETAAGGRRALVSPVSGVPRCHPTRVRSGRASTAAVAACLAPLTAYARGSGARAGSVPR